MKTNGLNFGQAIELLKRGNKLARSGWNGKGMFIYLVRGTEIPSTQLRNEAKEKMGIDESALIKINPHIDMKAADGSIVIGWLASQTDMMAEDWVIVE